MYVCFYGYMEVRKYGCIERWMHACMYVCIYVCMDVYMDVCMYVWMDGMDGCMYE